MLDLTNVEETLILIHTKDGQGDLFERAGFGMLVRSKDACRRTWRWAAETAFGSWGR